MRSPEDIRAEYKNCIKRDSKGHLMDCNPERRQEIELEVLLDIRTLLEHIGRDIVSLRIKDRASSGLKPGIGDVL